MSCSDALTILVGSSGPAVALHDALRDWSAEGLLNVFVWVTAESAMTADPVGLLVDNGAEEGVGVSEVLARRQPRVVRVVSLNMADGSDRNTTEPTKRLASLVRAAGGDVKLVTMRLFLVDPARTCQEPRPVEGWHNVLLSPEDAQSPTSLKMSLPSTTTVTDFGAWAAPSVAALTGLYAGLATSPFDLAAPLPGIQVRVARAFFRRLDATAVENDLRAQVLSLGGNYPEVRDGSQESQYIEDSGVELATSTMAKALWSQHQHLLKGARVKATAAPVQSIGPLRALKMFFSFLLSAVKNAPVAWWQSVVAGTKAKLASGVQNAVFGDSDSQYRVAVTGMAEGASLTLRERLAAIRSMERAVASEFREQVVHADLSELWKDYVAGALTLLDGGQRQQAMPPVQIGAQRGVLAWASQCVPDQSHAFTTIPGALASAGTIRVVPPADTMTAHQLWEHLDRLSTDPLLGVEAELTKRELDIWASKNQQTYVAQCAGVPAASFLELTGEIEQLHDLLERASSLADPDKDSKQILVRTTKLLRWLLIGLGVVLVLLVVCGVFAVLGWLLVSVLSLVSLVGWLGSSLLVFLHGQRDLFQWLVRRENAVSQCDAAQRNLVEAIRDARRVGDIYRLFLHWSRVLGAFLADPLGEGAADAHSASVLASRLPLAVGLGVAHSDVNSLAQAAQELRAWLFTPGWLDEVWEACVGAAGAQLGPGAAAALAHPEEIYRERAVEGSHLVGDWADVLERDGVRSQAGDRMWKEQALEHTDLESLATSISEPDGTRTTFAKFMDGAQIPQDVPGRPRLFADTAFSADARVYGKHAVAETWQRVVHLDVGRGAVLVEMSAGVRPSELVGRSTTSGDGSQ